MKTQSQKETELVWNGFTILIIIGILMAIYFTFFDKSPGGNDYDYLNEGYEQGSGVYRY